MAGPAAATATAPTESSSGGVDQFSSQHLPGNEDPSGAPAGAEPVVEDSVETAEAEATTEQPEAEATEGENHADHAAKPAETVAPKLYAGQFKTPEELEVAYGHSSNEGKRLAGEVKTLRVAHDKAVGELQDKIAELEIRAEVGPEIQEPTDEALEAMGPVKATRLLQKISDRKAQLATLKARKESRDKEAKQSEAQLSEHINRQIDDLRGRFPDYIALRADMESIMDAEPGILGHPNTPQIVALAAYGRRAIKRDQEASAVTKKSEEAAKAKVKAAAVGAGAAGASGGGAKEPAKKQGQDSGGDDSFNASFQKHAASRNTNW